MTWNNDMSAAPDWQPIETAPKNGTHIILAWDRCNGLPPVASEAFWRCDMPFSGNGIWWYFAGRLFQEPTHWMHLPTPPQETDNAE